MPWSFIAPAMSALPSQRPAPGGAAGADGGAIPDSEWREALAAVRAASVALVAERQELKALRSQAMAEEDEILAAVQATRDELRALAKVPLPRARGPPGKRSSGGRHVAALVG